MTWAALSKLLASLAEGELDETESVAASAAEAALLADPGTAPLIDRKMLASFSRNLSADEAAQFIGEAVEESRRVITMLEEADDPEAARLLHRLKGTARSFGLARVGAFAAAMEHRAKSGARREMLPDLDNTLEETEAAIAQGLD